ncbi:MAG: adenosylcobinamide-phosphate synthase CbiB [Pseudomonadota bacterium]
MTLVLAMLLDAALGEPKWLWSRLPHPAVLMGRAVQALEERLNDRTVARGALALAALVLAAGLIGWVLSFGGPVVEVLVAAILLAQRSLVTHVRAVADELRLSVASGRRAVAMIVSRDVRSADGPAISRAAIESAAENLSDGVIAPAFWFAVAGLPGIVIYKVVNTADSMIGYRNDRYEAFGKAAARADDVLNWIPARLTAGFIALVGVVADLPGIAADARRHRSPNAGWPEAAMARALNVALAGPRSYDGTVQDLAWVHPEGAREIGPPQIDAAVLMLWKAWGAALALVLFTTLL